MPDGVYAYYCLTKIRDEYYLDISGLKLLLQPKTAGTSPTYFLEVDKHREEFEQNTKL